MKTRIVFAALFAAVATVASGGLPTPPAPRPPSLPAPPKPRAGSVRVDLIPLAPPLPRVEARIASPGAAHVWVEGYYRWSAGDYVWVPGHWSKPPFAGARWAAPRYVAHQGGYRFVSGHWANPRTRTVVVGPKGRKSIVHDEPRPRKASGWGKGGRPGNPGKHEGHKKEK